MVFGVPHGRRVRPYASHLAGLALAGSLPLALQHELQAHLRMQHQLLSQLNQVVLPAVERLHTDGSEGDNGGGGEGNGHTASNGNINGVAEAKVKSEEEEDDDDDDDDDEDESGEDGPSPGAKRRKTGD